MIKFNSLASEMTPLQRGQILGNLFLLDFLFSSIFKLLTVQCKQASTCPQGKKTMDLDLSQQSKQSP